MIAYLKIAVKETHIGTVMAVLKVLVLVTPDKDALIVTMIFVENVDILYKRKLQDIKKMKLKIYN